MTNIAIDYSTSNGVKHYECTISIPARMRECFVKEVESRIAAWKKSLFTAQTVSPIAKELGSITKEYLYTMWKNEALGPASNFDVLECGAAYVAVTKEVLHEREADLYKQACKELEEDIQKLRVTDKEETRRLEEEVVATTPYKSCAEMVAANESKMQVFVKSLTGKTITIRIEEDWRVSQIKSAIEDASGIPVGQQRLIYSGMQLKDDRAIDYGIKSESTLHLVLTLRGGMFETVSGRWGSYTSDVMTVTLANILDLMRDRNELVKKKHYREKARCNLRSFM